MSEILKKIKEDLTIAMKIEIQYRKLKIITDMDPMDIDDNPIHQKTVSRAIISMFPEIKKKPSEATDEDTIKLLKRYINTEKERELYVQKHLTEVDVSGLDHQQLKKLVSDKMESLGVQLTSPVIEIAKGYLPKQATDEEITEWITANVDLSQYKNKMQAMGLIMKQFKGADGNRMRGILNNV